MDKIPGRPAYPRPAGLVPQYTMPRNFSRVIMSTNPSQSNLVSSKFTKKDRKAWAIEGWVHFQCPIAVSRPKLPWARMCNRWLMRQWNGGPRGAKPRPAGLTITGFGPNHLPPTSRRQSKPSTKSRWPDGGIPRPASPTLQCLKFIFAWKLRQPTLLHTTDASAKYRPLAHINRLPILTCETHTKGALFSHS